MHRLLLPLLMLAATVAHAADYTRDGGTADWTCCADKACSTILSQHADPVRAYNACGKLTDADGVTRYVRSNAFRITASSPPTPPETPDPLAAPISLTATASTTAIRLTWSAVAGAAAYQVERCGNAGCTSFTTLWCQAAPTVERSNTNLPAGSTWRYRIRARSAADCSGDAGPYSAIATATLLTPSGLRWDVPADAAAIVLHSGPAPDALWDAELIEPADARTYAPEVRGKYHAISYQLPDGHWSEVSNVVRY